MKTLVLIHGAHNDATIWAPLGERLARHGFQLLTPELPGHGANRGAALPSIEAMASWLLAWLDEGNTGPVLLGGHSMGSLVALEAAFQAPGRVAGLALLGSTWPMKVAPALLETALHDEAAALRMVAQWSHANLALVDETVAYMARLSALHPHHVLHNDLQACNSYANGDSAAQGVRCPTLFVCGTQDRMTSLRSSAALRAAIPHALTREVAAGHQMMAEQPDEVVAALLDWATTSTSITSS